MPVVLRRPVFLPTHLANKYGHKEIVHNKSLGGMTVVKVKEEHCP